MPLTIGGKAASAQPKQGRPTTVQQVGRAEHIACLGDACRRFLCGLCVAARKRTALTRKLDDLALRECFPLDHPYRLAAEQRERLLKLAETKCCLALIRRWTWAADLWETVPIAVREQSRAPQVWGRHAAEPILTPRIWDRDWQGATALPPDWQVPRQVTHWLDPADVTGIAGRLEQRHGGTA